MTCDSHVASENEDTIMSAARYFDKGGKYRCIVGQNIVSPYWLTGLLAYPLTNFVELHRIHNLTQMGLKEKQQNIMVLVLILLLLLKTQ